MRNRVLTILAVLGVATSALAQDVTDDWSIVRQPEHKTIFAYVPTSTGLVIGFRCMDGSFGALIGGLPEAGRNDRLRTLRIGMNGEPASESLWSVTTDRTVAMADYPAQLARNMRVGGAVSITIPGAAEGGRNLRHELILPASTAAIDETLTACGRPLVDPRDALLPDIGEDGLPEGVNWAVMPRPGYPSTHYSEGYTVLSCVVQPDGRLNQCVVESEFPLDGGFGRNSLRAAARARIASPGETPGRYAPRLIAFRINYVMR